MDIRKLISPDQKSGRFPLYDKGVILAKTYLLLAGVTLITEGKDNLFIEHPAIISPNHWSPPYHPEADHLVLGAAHSIAQGNRPQKEKRQLRYVAKDPLFKNWFLAGLLRGVGSIAASEIDQMTNALKQGSDLVVYPEGGVRFNQGDRIAKIERGVGVLARKTSALTIPTSIIYGCRRGLISQETMVEFGEPIDFSGVPIKQQQQQLAEAMNENMLSARLNFKGRYGYPPETPISRADIDLVN